MLESIIVARFQIQAELPLSPRPEHEIQRRLSGNGIPGAAMDYSMLPFWPDAEHELDRIRQCEWLLEEEVGIQFRLAPAEQGRDATLQFQPVRYRRRFNREVCPEGRAAFQTPSS